MKALKHDYIKAKNKLDNALLKASVAVGTVMLATNAHAAPDVTTVINDIKEVVTPVNAVGAATVGVLVTLYGWAKVRRAIR